MGLDAKRFMLERRAPGPVDDGVRRVATYRRRRCRPAVATLLIAKIEHLAHGIADRIVVPRGETKKLAVLHPGARCTTLADEEPTVRIGDDVRPWRGWHAVATHTHEIIAVGSDTAEAVIEAKRLVRHPRPVPPWNTPVVTAAA